MSQNKHKCSGKDDKKNEQQEKNSNPKKDVELCLEVEMDDEVREIITSPEKCMSTLLDVTVIKPKDLDHLYCTKKTTLSGEEVRKLITSMELEKQDKQKLIEKLLSVDDAFVSVYKQSSHNPKSAGDYVKKKNPKKTSGSSKVKQGPYKKCHDPAQFIEQIQKISTSDETYSDPVYSARKRPGKKCDDQVQQIYTTPKTYTDIKSIFTCKNKNNYDQNEKPEKPCLCRNCAIVGVLTDSQKKPFITENLYDPKDLSNMRKECKRRKCVNFKEDTDHIECEYYFRHLAAKIRRLEERLSIQEEKSVPRDYFKRIITKLVAHLSKITNYAGYETHSNTPLKSRGRESKEHDKVKEKYGDKRYYVHPVLYDPKLEKVVTDFEDILPTPSRFNCNDKRQASCESFWKWGEEILRPGVDLKNKIVMLLEDTLYNWKKPGAAKLDCIGTALGGEFELPQKIPKDVPERDVPKKNFRTSCKCTPNATNSNSGIGSLKSRNYRSYENRGKRFQQGKQDVLYEEQLNVSYVNPEMSRWQEESQVSFKLDSSDIDSLKHAEERRLNDSCEYYFYFGITS